MELRAIFASQNVQISPAAILQRFGSPNELFNTYMKGELEGFIRCTHVYQWSAEVLSHIKTRGLHITLSR